MEHSIENTVRRLKELNAPQLLVQLAAGTRAPGVLESEFQVPQEFYSVVSDPRFPFKDSIVPLWETNGDSITGFVDLEAPFVIRYYYEDPPSEYEILGHSIMQAIEHQLEWLLAECGYEPDEVMAAARACEHPSPEDFLRKIQDCE
jgi:hypothetical protein